MDIVMNLGNGANEIMVVCGEKQETYNLLSMPSAASLLVEDAKQELLGRINIVSFFKNLSICADLFGVAYDAVNGTKELQSSIWKLRENLNDAVTKSADYYVNGFNHQIQKVPTYYNIAVKALLGNEMNVEKSKKAFSLIRDVADQICTELTEMIAMFEQLKNDAAAITQKVIDAKAMDIEQKKEIQKNMDELNSQLAGLVTIQKDLEAEIAELTEQYNKLDKKIDAESKKQFWLNITSAIAGAIGVGLSAYVSASTGKAINNTTGNTSGNTGAQSSVALEKTQKNLDYTKEKIEKTELAIKELEKKLDDITQQIAVEKDEQKKDTLMKEKQNIADQLELQKESLKKLNAEAKSYTETIAGIGAGLTNISDKLDKEGNKIADSVTSLTQMADAIATKKTELNKQKREILGKIATYTKTVENSVITKNSLELAVASLSAGIGAMNFIVSVLNEFYAFWIRLKSYTQNLAGNEVENYYLLNEDSPEELKSIDFLSVIAKNACQWMALQLVLKDYQNAFYDVREKLQAQLKEAEDPNPEVMWRRAIDRSKGLSEIIQIQAEGM